MILGIYLHISVKRSNFVVYCGNPDRALTRPSGDHIIGNRKGNSLIMTTVIVSLVLAIECVTCSINAKAS